MGDFYSICYILSSLPFLAFQGRPPLAYPDFVALCAPWLRAQDFAQLQLARIDIENIPLEDVTSEMLRRWISFENTLRNELVKIRAKNLHVPEERYLREDIGLDASALSLVHQAIEDPSPHRAEMNLVGIRWEFLTQLESGHCYDLPALMLYSLKLQLLERLQTFDEERGIQVLTNIVERSFHGHE